jgi:hypothetical protein
VCVCVCVCMCLCVCVCVHVCVFVCACVCVFDTEARIVRWSKLELGCCVPGRKGINKSVLSKNKFVIT